MKKIKFVNLGLLLALLLITPLLSLAQGPGQQFPISEPPQPSPILEGKTLGQVLLDIFTWVLRILTWVAGAFAVLYIIWGGIQVIIQAKIDEGKQRLIYGAVGLAIALLSWAVVKFIERLVTTGTVL